ncbi:MAG: 4-hydroxy-tetrahydrodipicolinate reductase [Lysobacteraceae bacterium]
MTTPIRLLIHGASGRMGRAVLRLAAEDPRFVVAAAVSGQGVPLAEAGDAPVLAAAMIEDVEDFDLALDFSLPPAFGRLCALCARRGAMLVSGTTGLDAAQFAALDALATRVAVLWAANFSLGVAVMADLARRAAQALAAWDIDLVESHHVHKRDAPSGTALALGQAVAQGAGREPRYASLRAGDIVGEHLLQFSGAGERLELVHRAGHRDIFARGALECAARLAGRGPGRHAIADLLFADG